MYSTGHNAETSASRAPISTMAATTGRHAGEGSRPSGNDIMVMPLRTRTRARGHTPNHITHDAPGRCVRSWPTAWRPY